MTPITTAEIMNGLTMSGGEVAVLEIRTGRQHGKKGLTLGKKAGTIVDDDVPTLLRTVADLYEQEGGWDGIVTLLEEARA